MKISKSYLIPIVINHFIFCFGSGLFAASEMQETGKKPELYQRFELPWDSLCIAEKYLPRNPVIVEAGAFDGKESCKIARYWPEGRIYCFEPISQLFAIVKKNTKKFPNISAYQLALGSQLGQLTMHLSEEPSWKKGMISMSSSLYPPKDHLIYSDTKFKGEETVAVTTLDAWAIENHISHVDMLWLDMQGYELPVLKAAPNILKTVSVILTELEFCEAYEGQPLYQEVKSWLEEEGFVLIAGNFDFPKNHDQWFGDGLFVRRNLIK